MQMKKLFSVFVGLMLVNGMSTYAAEQEKCPVKNKAVDGKKVVEKDGKKIKVCCGNCEAKVKQNFDKYVKKLEKKGIDLSKK
jgi:hypothetical protein